MKLPPNLKFSLVFTIITENVDYCKLNFVEKSKSPNQFDLPELNRYDHFHLLYLAFK
ncbi:hypothetical protein P261_00484 [Lachnospiraceae bacterium TWA4]|nr:hypothetical protein P261_00484 [Lachnospiraceae bacterium TWA4]